MLARLKYILIFCLLGLAIVPVRAENSMTYIYNAPESALDHRYDYQWEILRTALDKTKDKYGGYLMQKSLPMNEKRQTNELVKGSGKITVMHLGTSQAFEKALIPIRIPVDKNLSGYMVYLIRKDQQQRFSSVKTLDDLRGFSIGQGADWLDVNILRHNGFNVVGGSNYDGLFHMLIKKRFDAFQRSAAEILDEYDQRKKDLPDLHIEQDLLVYYPLPMYFWFSKTETGRRLADRAREGMFMMFEDGTYDAIFTKYNGDKIERLHLKDRKFFRIDNPLLVPETPFDDKRLWYDPRSK